MKNIPKKNNTTIFFCTCKKKLCKICNFFLYVGFPFFCNGYLRPLNMTPPQTRRLCCVYNTKHLLHVRLSTPARHRTFATCQQSRTKKCDLSSFFSLGRSEAPPARSEFVGSMCLASASEVRGRSRGGAWASPSPWRCEASGGWRKSNVALLCFAFC